VTSLAPEGARKAIGDEPVRGEIIGGEFDYTDPDGRDMVVVRVAVPAAYAIGRREVLIGPAFDPRRVIADPRSTADEIAEAHRAMAAGR
jgi:hypothetical protein